MDNKIIELNTKLELLLNNIGNAKDENGEVNLQKKFDLSGLNDFMQKLAELENKFDDYISSTKTDELNEKIKKLEDNKVDKNDFEKLKKFSDELDKKIKENNDNINEINKNIEKLKEDINILNNEREQNKYREENRESNIQGIDAENLDLYLAKYVLKSNYDDFLKVNKEKINKIMDELDKINNQIKEIKNTLAKKSDANELSELREFLTNKLEEIINESTKKFSDKEDTSKFLKYLEDQIKNLYISLKSKAQQSQ